MKESRKFVFLSNILFAIAVLPLLFIKVINSTRTDWFSDNARDFLVVKNIVEHQDYKWLAPFAQGSENNLVNSGFYYYLISMFYPLSFGDETIYKNRYTSSLLLTVLLYSYLIAKLFFKKQLIRKLIVLTFLYFTTFFKYGSFFFQPNFMIPIILGSLYHIFAAYENKSLKHLTAAIILYSLSLHIHYSSLVMTPLMLIVIIFFQIKVLNKHKFKELPLILVIANFILLLINQIYIKGTGSGWDDLSVFFTKMLTGKTEFITNFTIFISGLEENYYPILMQFSLHLGLLLTSIIVFLRKRSFYSNFFLLNMLLSFPVFFMVEGLGGWETFYFLPIYASVFTGFVYSLSQINSKTQLLLLIIISIYFMLPPINYLMNMDSVFSDPNSKHKLAAQVITNDVNKTNSYNEFFIYTIDDLVNFNNSIYWLYIVKETDEQILENVSFDRYSVFPKTEYAKKAYLICDNPRNDQEEEENKKHWCLEKILLTSQVSSFEQIYLSKEDNFFIYRLNFKNPVHRFELTHL